MQAQSATPSSRRHSLLPAASLTTYLHHRSGLRDRKKATVNTWFNNDKLSELDDRAGRSHITRSDFIRLAVHHMLKYSTVTWLGDHTELYDRNRTTVSTWFCDGKLVLLDERATLLQISRQNFIRVAVHYVLKYSLDDLDLL